jgi:hypothetical protein
LKGPRSRWTGIPRYPEHRHLLPVTMNAISCLQKIEPGPKEPNLCRLDSRAASKSRLAGCLKHPSHRPHGNARIERIPRATLLSGSREPKVINACM